MLFVVTGIHIIKRKVHDWFQNRTYKLNISRQKCYKFCFNRYSCTSCLVQTDLKTWKENKIIFTENGCAQVQWQYEMSNGKLYPLNLHFLHYLHYLHYSFWVTPQNLYCPTEIFIIYHAKLSFFSENNFNLHYCV